MTPYRTIGARIFEARGTWYFDPVAAATRLWTGLRPRIARFLATERADRAHSTWLGAMPLDDRVLRDIGVTRFGVREKAVTEPLELEIRKRAV